jgi:hypothetical protein
MSDFLSNITAKSLNMAPVVQPRPVLLFEPVHSEGMLGTGHRFPGGAIDGLSESDQREDAEIRSIAEARPQTKIYQPQADSIMEHSVPMKAPKAVKPETPNRGHESDHVPRSPLEISETVIDKESVRSPSQEAGPQREVKRDDVSTAKTLSTGEQHRPRVKPFIERVAIDLPGVPRNAGVAAMVPVSRGKMTPSFRTKETMPVQSSPDPTIQVTIGRIEVRATTPAVPPQKQWSVPKTMSLDEYLGKHRGGGR